MNNDFKLFARDRGISSNTLDEYSKYVVRNGYINPTIIEERQLNIAAIDVFSRLQMDNILFLGSEIDSNVANIVNAQMLYLDSLGNGMDIKMFINSPGGDVNAGLAIYDIMNFIDCDVQTYCIGMAASMASVLLSSGTKGKRFVLPNSEVMLHQVSGKSVGQFSDMEIAVKHASRIQEKLYTILAKNAGKSFGEIERDADRDYWLNAEESVDYGLVDKIINKKRV